VRFSFSPPFLTIPNLTPLIDLNLATFLCVSFPFPLKCPMMYPSVWPCFSPLFLASPSCFDGFPTRPLLFPHLVSPSTPNFGYLKFFLPLEPPDNCGLSRSWPNPSLFFLFPPQILLRFFFRTEGVRAPDANS